MCGVNVHENVRVWTLTLSCMSFIHFMSAERKKIEVKKRKKRNICMIASHNYYIVTPPGRVVESLAW